MVTLNSTSVPPQSSRGALSEHSNAPLRCPEFLPSGPGLLFLYLLPPTSLVLTPFIHLFDSASQKPAELAVRNKILITEKEEGKWCRQQQRLSVLQCAWAQGSGRGGHTHRLRRWVSVSKAMWQPWEEIISTLWWEIWSPSELSKVTNLTNDKIRTRMYITTKPTVPHQTTGVLWKR